MADPGPARRRVTPSARPPVLLRSSPLMLCGIALCLVIFFLEGTTTMASTHNPRLEAPAATLDERRNKCWIFTHLQKCGGTTVKDILLDSWGGHRYTVYDSVRWKWGDFKTNHFHGRVAGGTAWQVVAGGYTEALRRAATSDDITATAGATCVFFTLFRHPISRMVSAYFYCQSFPQDSACASMILRARDVDLLTFAKHWSNFGLRQFALNFVSADDVMA